MVLFQYIYQKLTLSMKKLSKIKQFFIKFEKAEYLITHRQLTKFKSHINMTSINNKFKTLVSAVLIVRVIKQN